MEDGLAKLVGYALVIAVAGVLASLGACSDKKVGYELLPALGMKEPQYQGFGWFDCGELDWYRSRYTAVYPDGKRRRVTICEGLLFKERTVRYD